MYGWITMKRPTLTSMSRSSETDMDEQISEAVMDAIKSGDKTIEIRPASRGRSTGSRIRRLLLFLGAAIGISYWLQKSQRSTDVIENATSKTADRTKQVTEQAAQTIKGGGETVAERVEEGSQKAGEKVEETGEDAAEKTERTGEKAAKKADESEISSSAS